ncbi:eCIS core domain-containing protein [Actinoplanes regularis]|uniref:eCIS core domain-containing protein n=1 Tax=Actinoplanes regularis TaxID=52697 RepID=A0A239C146_9ACTN|nr:DUF4157 domain-containing protein [Actinoplanes regularis]GIE88165.1 hypothetical protein Are01nite_46450 [Actinoplanes regularis]SNS13967.1 protein of unknown function [Actinoplanes regularis]
MTPAAPGPLLLDPLRHEGRGLDARARIDMERSLGAPFGDVVVHTGAASAAAADQAHAAAFTFGRHVVFGPHAYDPGSVRGRMLLAHELAHVVQQRRGGGIEAAESLPAESLSRSRSTGAGGTHEHAAGVTAAQAALGMSAPVAGAAPAGVAREDKDSELSWRDRLWTKAKRELREKSLMTLGAVEGLALEAGQIVDTVAWVESKKVDLVDDAIDWAGQRTGVSEETRTLIKQFNEPGFKAMREAAKKAGMVDPQTGAPIVSEKLTQLADRGEKAINDTFGGPEDPDSFFTSREAAQLVTALGSQVALALVGVEEVQLLLKVVSAAGVIKAVSDAVEHNPTGFATDRRFWTAVANGVLHFAGLASASAGKKIVTLVIDVIGVTLSTGSEIAQLREDWALPAGEERTKRLRKDVLGLVKAVISAIRQALTHHQTLKKTAGGGVQDESAPANHRNTGQETKSGPPEPTSSTSSTTPPTPGATSTAGGAQTTTTSGTGSTVVWGDSTTTSSTRPQTQRKTQPATPKSEQEPTGTPVSQHKEAVDLALEGEWKSMGALLTGGKRAVEGEEPLPTTPPKQAPDTEGAGTTPSPKLATKPAPASAPETPAPTTTPTTSTSTPTPKQLASAKKAAAARTNAAQAQRALAEQEHADAAKSLLDAEWAARKARKTADAAQQAHTDAPKGQQPAARKQAEAAKNELEAAYKTVAGARNRAAQSHQDLVRARGNVREAQDAARRIGRPPKAPAGPAPQKHPNAKNNLPPPWDHAANPYGPNRRWKPGDPVDMPSPSGAYPRWDTIRTRVWRSVATEELADRQAGRSVKTRKPGIDPARELSDAQLKQVVKTGKMPKRVEAEIEHDPIPQRVGRMLEDVGVGRDTARRLSGLGDSNNLLPTNKNFHAINDAVARLINPSRNKSLKVSLDDRLENPLASARPAEVAAIVESLKGPGVNLNTPSGERLRSALRDYKFRNRAAAPWEVP